ncbi:MAG: VWA domain-containing protein [Spirochaetales bacterium]|nr:VWA domain-containing protein [Spirochaetales bacterium]
MKTLIASILFFIFISNPGISGIDLTLDSKDIYIEKRDDGGYHVFVKKKPDIKSVLLVDTTKDPTKKEDNYTLRTKQYNPINGDEKRLLNGKFLILTDKTYSIVDSTPEKNERFGEAFHLFIPIKVIYGYPWSRHGELVIRDGTFLNLRCFSKPFADYTGSFLDNPFTMNITTRMRERSLENYHPETVDSFAKIAEKGRGNHYFADNDEELLRTISEILDKEKGESLDLVLAIDTTKSMKEEMPGLKKNLLPTIREHTNQFKIYRIGLVFYKDYEDDYLTKTYPFETDMGNIQKTLDGVVVRGGRDDPEAVFEALYAATDSFSWESASRVIILIGDAPPHSKPRGDITEDMIYENAIRLSISINTIIIPD